MNPLARKIQRVYLTLQLGNTLAASFIWGINTLFLLDAGLGVTGAFAASTITGALIFPAFSAVTTPPSAAGISTSTSSSSNSSFVIRSAAGKPFKRRSCSIACRKAFGTSIPSGR